MVVDPLAPFLRQVRSLSPGRKESREDEHASTARFVSAFENVPNRHVALETESPCR